MKRNWRFSLRLAVLASCTAVALISTTAGALAWYAYSRSVRFSFIGTSVTKSALLSVGLVDDNNYLSSQDCETFGLSIETHDNHRILFTQSQNGLSVQAIRKFLFNSPHAVDRLFPLTTQDRALNDESTLQLWKNPEYGTTDINIPASPNEYVVLPFAFKILNEDQDHIANKHVWITECVSQAQRGIQGGLRIYIEGTDRNFLMRPSDSSTVSGKTKVGGVLDLDGDGTYDYNKGSLYEFAYGKFENTATYSSTEYGIPKADAPLDNVNGVDDVSEASTFLAKHYEHAYTANIAAAKPLVAEYETFGTVKPSVTSNGEYYTGETGVPIASTNSGSKIGYTTMTIFIEGWDHSVIDKAAGYQFNLGLKFEIDRL